jgi:hypothetical protein
MEIGDAVRITEPADAIEYRLGYVSDLHFSTPHTTHVARYTVLFPGGTERTYPAERVVRCTRADDRTALETAYTEAFGRLRAACRIAHDFNDDLSGGTARLLAELVEVARRHLGVALLPEDRPKPGAGTDRDGGQ